MRAKIEINKRYNENNLETMAKMPNGFVDYILTSPPYNVGKNQLNGEGKKYILNNDTLCNMDYFNK